MDVNFISRDVIKLLGISFYGDPFKEAGDWSAENEIGRLCRRYMDFAEDNSGSLMPILVNDDFYEVHIYTPETDQKGYFEVFVGQAINKVQPIPLELSIKILPSSRYAVFNLVGEQIVSDWYSNLDQILKDKGWQRGAPFFFQVYDRRYKGLQRIAESELSAYIPVIPQKS